MPSGWFFACYIVYIIKQTPQKHKVLSIKMLPACNLINIWFIASYKTAKIKAYFFEGAKVCFLRLLPKTCNFCRPEYLFFAVFLPVRSL